jgi:predicted P-loop ATPase
MDNPKNQNRMRVLKGAQGIGKDRCADALAGALDLHYGKPEFQNAKFLSGRDIFFAVQDKAVCLFDEFDKYASATSVIKSLITKDKFSVEKKYENNSVEAPHRCSYIGTTNTSVWHDTTGTRRFLYFELLGGEGHAIKFDYPNPELVSSQEWCRQVLAQGYHLYKTQPLVTDEEAEAVMKAIQSEATPDDPGTELFEDFLQEIRSLRLREMSEPWRVFFKASELRDVFKTLTQVHGVGVNAVKQTIATKGGKQRLQCKLDGKLHQCKAYGIPSDFRDIVKVKAYFMQRNSHTEGGML